MAKTFALQIGRFIGKAQGNMDLVLRKVALDLHRRVVLRTPVDTGRARGNWQIGVNTISRGETGATGGKRAVAADAGAAALSGLADAKAGDRVFIVNSVPYIFRLEQGHSQKQAPQGMVAVTLREYPGIVSREAGETRRGG